MTTVADLVLTEHIGKRIAVETPLGDIQGTLTNLMSVQEWPRFRKGPDDTRVVIECQNLDDDDHPDRGWHMPFNLTDKVTFLDEARA